MADERAILILENNSAMRFALGRISLDGLRVEILPADGWENIEGKFIAILTDDSLLEPVNNELPLTTIKQKFQCPVLLMTGARNRRIASYAAEAGAKSVLFKPFGVAEFRKQISAAIGEDVSLLASSLSAGDSGQARPQNRGRVAGDMVFDELFIELERRQPLEEGLDAFDVVERHLVGRALKACAGNQSQAARFLGITRNTLRKRIKKYGFAGLLIADDQTPDNSDS